MVLDCVTFYPAVNDRTKKEITGNGVGKTGIASALLVIRPPIHHGFK